MPEWISVKDRLPEEDEIVLLYRKTSKKVAIGFRVRIADFNFWECIQPNTNEYTMGWCGAGIVSHWMPLPEPPKEVNDGD